MEEKKVEETQNKPESEISNLPFLHARVKDIITLRYK